MKYAIFEEKGKYCLRTAGGSGMGRDINPWSTLKSLPGVSLVYETEVPEFFVSEWERVDEVLKQQVDLANKKGGKLDLELLESLVTPKNGGK